MADTSFYVAANGNDAASGTLAAPFATLARARDEVRKIGTAQGPVTVFVRGGVYRLNQPLRLEARDSGTASAPIVYRAYQQEKPVLTAAAAISGFTRHEGKILKASTAKLGYFRQLFFDGKRQPLARYPNYDPSNPYGGGWAYADGKAIPMYQNVDGEDKHSMQFKSTDLHRWAHPEQGEVFIFPRYNWWNNIVPIQSIDAETRKVTLASDCSYTIRPGDRYYVQNLLEELDAPGEWYLDKQAEVLYFWPPDGVDAGALTVYAPTQRTILEIGKGTSYVTFRGFSFEYFAGNAITLTGTSHVLIAGNAIRNGGDYNGSGVTVNGGSENGVVGNDISAIGSNGISISGGDRITLTAAGNYADNNYIHHVGVYYKQGVGILLNGCGNRATHNLIHDTPRMAIMFSGNNLEIDYNHLRHTNLETADTGAVYTGGRDWISSRGTKIRYNYMHDSLGYGFENGKWVSPHYSWIIYLDDNTGGVDVIGNILVRAYRGLIHLHNGRDNLIENNILVDGKLQQVELSGWLSNQSFWISHLPTMIIGYNSVKDQPSWKNMRNMGTAPTEAVLPNGLIMTGNVFRRNIVYYRDPASKLFSGRNLPLEQNTWEGNLYWNGGGGPMKITLGGKDGMTTLDDWRGKGLDRNSIVADPMFVAPQSEDYRLRQESPAFRLGFQQIPVEKIGPYADALRATWPLREAEGAREHPPTH